MLIVGGYPQYWHYNPGTHHVDEELVERIRVMCYERGIIFASSLMFFESVEGCKVCVPVDIRGGSAELKEGHFHFGVTKAVSIHFTLHFCVDKWLCDFIQLMYTSSLSVEHAMKNKMASTSKGFDTQ